MRLKGRVHRLDKKATGSHVRVQYVGRGPAMKTSIPPPYTMTCSANVEQFDERRKTTALPLSAGRPEPRPASAWTQQHHRYAAAGRGYNGQYPQLHSPPPPPPPPSLYVSYKRPAAAGRPWVSTQTLIIALFIMMSLFSCIMTVALTYKTHAAHLETSRQIEEVILDLKSFADIVRDELVAKRVNLENEFRAQQQRQKLQLQQQQQQQQQQQTTAKSDAVDYDEAERLPDDESDDNRFMGVDLDDNEWPKNGGRRTAAAGAESNRRRRRSAAIDVQTKMQAKNELNRFTPEIASPVVPLLLTKTLDVVDAHLKTKYSTMFTDVVNSLTGSVNNKQFVETIERESNDENTVPTHNYRQERNMQDAVRKKHPPVEHRLEIVAENKEKTHEGMKTMPQPLAAAAHFASDSSKYNTRTHSHYRGNGHLKHPDGDYRDWSQHIWSGNSNVNHFELKNGKVEISTPGVYFVYAQIYYSDPHDVNGYYIMKNEEKVLGCTSTRHQETQSDSCYTAGLIYFNSKDILSIRGLDTERYIILDPIKSFFGLFEVAKHFR